MDDNEKEVWHTIRRHLESIFTRDVAAYTATTSEDLSLYEWFVTPHRQDGLPFHLFMIENTWIDTDADYRYDLWEPRLQLYGNTAIATYTFMLTFVKDGKLTHSSHNESRVLIKDGGWKVVHTHKSPAWNSPKDPPSFS